MLEAAISADWTERVGKLKRVYLGSHEFTVKRCSLFLLNDGGHIEHDVPPPQEIYGATARSSGLWKVSFATYWHSRSMGKLSRAA
jgi:hypothetical protein